MKKLLSIGLAVLLTICMGLSLVGCSSYYYDPKGKEWYNVASLPYISKPFNEIYDGCYSIQIDKDGNVTLKTLKGEEINGTLSTSFDNKNLSSFANISIQFENGKTATGKCSTKDKERTLSIYYDGATYKFGEKRQLSKEEFETYRSQFVEFLTSVYQTGSFPTEQEIESNSLYKQFTNYFQIDPCCGGPFVYDVVEKATIEKVEIKEYGTEFSYNINGKSEVFYARKETFVATIKNGEIKKSTLSDIKEGICLISTEGTYNPNVIGIFYIENE